LGGRDEAFDKKTKIEKGNTEEVLQMINKNK
jgi:hypothetical protein